jgi:hypothetical protein
MSPRECRFMETNPHKEYDNWNKKEQGFQVLAFVTTK